MPPHLLPAAVPRPQAVVPVRLTRRYGGSGVPRHPLPAAPADIGVTGRGAGPHSLGRERIEGRASSRKTHPHASSL